jgi:hypothetical protein
LHNKSLVFIWTNSYTGLFNNNIKKKNIKEERKKELDRKMKIKEKM